MLAPVQESERASWEMLSEEEVIERIRGGEVALYEILMRRYNQRIYRIARSILRDASEAEDVMQEAYVRAYQHLNEFNGSAKFSTWLTKIAIYEALRRARRRGRLEELDSIQGTNEQIMEKLAARAEDPERQAYDHELRRVLESAVDALPEGYRAVFILRAVEGLSVAETAACLNLGQETVKTRLYRARAVLRKELERRAGLVASDIYPFHLSRCDRVVQGVLRRIGGGSFPRGPAA